MQIVFLMLWRFVNFDAVLEGIRLATKASFNSDVEWSMFWVEPTREWSTFECSKYRQRLLIVMSIMQHFALIESVVAIIGLIHMVPCLVDYEMHRIMMF